MFTCDDVFIGGEWRPSAAAGRLEVINPATEEAWASVPDGGGADIDAAVSAAQRALPAWSARSPHERAQLIERLAAEVEAWADEFTRVITAENGTPVAESGTTAPYAAAHLRHVAGLARLLEATDVRANPLGSGRAMVQRRPLGVAGLITPWNFPLALIILKLGPALLAGCTAVIKPAPRRRWRRVCSWTRSPRPACRLARSTWSPEARKQGVDAEHRADL